MNEQRETFPSGLEAIFIVVLLFVVEYLVGAAAFDLKTLLGVDPKDMMGIIVFLANGVLLTALIHYKRMSYASLFHPASHSIVATLGTLVFPILLVVPGLTLLLLIVMSGLMWVFPMPAWQIAMFDQMMSNGVAAFITVCILAPVLEEMLFRGIILRSFLQQYSRSASILGSAILFGAAHLNIYQFVVGFALGIIAGWLYERSRSLLPCIVFHGAYNCVVFILYRSMRDGDISSVSLLFWLASVPLAVIGYGMLKRMLVVKI